METNCIKEIINSPEPIAIMKYFEWPIFSNDYANARYSLLKMDETLNNIFEYDIPFNLVPFVLCKINAFDKVVKLNQGIVWERSGFREMVKRIIPKTKIHQLINRC